uniref:TctD transcriptional regulator n=1 Tax=Ophidocladus simpliciusculus TaxID=1261574 RepID=A0A1Z1MJQ9_9FLOR|nr:hypothetical protein [Ophidocladus simpliciusculus]ARW66082.1 hypothetical protein [Ophidocladus simpliciusculus]
MKHVKKILLVDDDQYIRNALSSYLFAEGFLVYSVDNVSSAFIVIKNSCPDLIITDIMIKGLNGYDFIKVIKLDSFLYHIPIIFLTAKGMTSDRIKGYNLGCNAYLTKPFHPQELLAIINNIFHQIDLLCSRSFVPIGTILINSKMLDTFTPRECNILQLVFNGYMNKEIALSLNISLRNVEKYISRLLSKTNTRNRVELVRSIINLYVRANDGNRTRV